MEKKSRICIVGSKGVLGHAIWKELEGRGYMNLIGCDLPEVDLCNQSQAKLFFEKAKPEFVFFLAAVAAGIQYKKTHPVDMLLKNLQMITNVMELSYLNGCKKMINVCSALLYPSEAKIPLREEDATHANLDEIDTPYALAKAAGMQLARYYNQQHGMNYLTVVPCNFFGEFAPFDGDRAGVVPSLISKIHNAKINNIKKVEVWGTGNACRELLNSKDVANACVFLMNTDTNYDLINIGRGKEYTIRNVAETIKSVVGYKGILHFDLSKPEGRAHMQLNTDKLQSLGWRPQMDLKTSIEDTYNWYIDVYRGLK